MRALRPHPSTPEGAWSVAARADRTDGGELRLRYVLQGALGGVRLPEPLNHPIQLYPHFVRYVEDVEREPAA